MIFVSKDTRWMIFIPFTNEFKQHYEQIKNNYNLIKNKPSTHNGNTWQSAFKIIPLDDIVGYYSKYKKINSKNKITLF